MEWVNRDTEFVHALRNVVFIIHKHIVYVAVVARWDIISACCAKKARETTRNWNTHGEGLL
jgi:hypothetical protein